MEAGGMARRAKHEYLGVMWQRYQRADRATRSALLDEVTRVCSYHRKYAIELLCRAAPPRPSVRRAPLTSVVNCGRHELQPHAASC